MFMLLSASRRGSDASEFVGWGRLGQRRSAVARGMRGSELLVLDRADPRRQREEAEEASRIALLVDVILAKGDEALVVEGLLALPSDHAHCTLVEARRDGPRQTLLRRVHEGIVRLTLGGPP